MKKIYSFLILSFLLSSCLIQYELESYQKTTLDVESELDSAIVRIITPYQDELAKSMNQIICYNAIDMYKGQPESILGNFVSDLCLKSVGDKADICVLNNGGLRSVLLEGDITKRMIYELMPFDNELVILELDRKEFEELLNYIIERGGEPIGGMKIRIQKDTTYVEINSKEYKNLQKIEVLTSDYLANGGDKMKFLKDKPQKKVGIKLRDVIMSYCESQDTIIAKLDNRIIHE